uniref:Uncharacterized protein n=1 Tax=Anguilla anguilla TaxID=7936 RepID=A0A0E9VBE1_ANGAN
MELKLGAGGNHSGKGTTGFYQVHNLCEVK